MARDVNLPQCSWRLCSPIHFLRFQEQHEYDHLKCIKQISNFNASSVKHDVKKIIL